MGAGTIMDHSLKRKRQVGRYAHVFIAQAYHPDDDRGG